MRERLKGMVVERDGGSGSALVEIEQAAQPLGFSNGPVGRTGLLAGGGDEIFETLMIAFMLMVGEIFLERMAQGALAEENQLIEAFFLDRTHPAFGKGVEVGGLWRQLESLNAGGVEDRIEVVGEYGIAVVEQEAGVGHGPVVGGDVAGDLFQPGLVGEWSDAGEDDSAGLEMEEEQDVEGGQAGGGPDFCGEEVGGPEHGRVSANELGPGGVAFAFGGRAQSLSLQNIADGLIGNVIPQISQGANNAVITPAWVFAGELHHQLFNLN